MSSQTATTPPEPQALPSPPSDGITCLKYIPPSSSTSMSSLLACSSWDGTIRIYDTKAMSNVCIQTMDSGPVLSLAVDGSGDRIFTGGLDGSGKSMTVLNVCVCFFSLYNTGMYICVTYNQEFFVLFPK